MSLKITEEQAEEIVYELSVNESFDDTDEFTLVEKSDWEGGGKWQSCYAIFKKIGEEDLYRLSATRTGSHYTEWYREYELNCPKVCRKERTIVEITYEDCNSSS